MVITKIMVITKKSFICVAITYLNKIKRPSRNIYSKDRLLQLSVWVFGHYQLH